MILRSSGVGIIIAALAFFGLYGLRTDTLAQRDPFYSKKLPMGTIPATEQFVEGEVLLKYKETSISSVNRKKRAQNLADLESLLYKDHKVRSAKTFIRLGIQRLRLPHGQSVKNAIEQLRKHTVVEFVEPNHKIFSLYDPPPNDRGWLEGFLWGMDAIGMKEAWKSTPLTFLRAGSPIVAVLDSGIAYQHPDLLEQMWINEQEINGTTGDDDDNNEIPDDIYGAGFCMDYRSGEGYAFGNISDGQYPHGTMVSGVIGAVYNNPSSGGDESGYVAGVYPKAKLMGMKILCGADNTGTVGDAIEAIEYAYEHGAHIINASWAIKSGGLGLETSGALGNASLKLAIQDAGNRGVLFVAAAGNNGIGASPGERDNDMIPVYPANYGTEGLDNVIAVAATSVCDGLYSPGRCDDQSPFNEKLSEMSHYGQGTVHLAAPGKDIVSTAWVYGISQPATVLMGDGTSFAAAHVSGCAALLQARRLAPPPVDRLTPRRAKLTPSELKSLLMDNGDPLSTLQGKTISGKRLNCNKALKESLSLPPSPPAGLPIR